MKLTAYNRRRRFPDWLDTPEACDICASPLVLMTNNAIAYKRPCGKWPYVYWCLDCGASVGCHPYSIFPLGRMADAATKSARQSLHMIIDPAWDGYEASMSRNEVYKLMANLLGFPKNRNFHIGELTIEECHRASAAFRSWETAADFSSDS